MPIVTFKTLNLISPQDYKTLEVPTQISENQKKRCEQIEQGVRKHLQQGKDKIYSDACPIRLWTSVLKYHKEAPELMKAFMRECDARNGKYGFFMGFFVRVVECYYSLASIKKKKNRKHFSHIAIRHSNLIRR